MNTRRTPDLDDLNPDQRAAICEFRDKHGPLWKEKLSNMWATGQDERQPNSGLLRQVRNQFGLSWLYKLKG